MKSPESRRMLRVEQLETRETPAAPVTTSLADAFGMTGFQNGWATRVAGGTAAAYSSSIPGAPANALRGILQPETIATTPSFGMGISHNPWENGGNGILQIPYYDLPPGQTFELRWVNGPSVQSATISGTGVRSFPAPQFNNQTVGSLYVVNGSESILIANTNIDGGYLGSVWSTLPTGTDGRKLIQPLAYSHQVVTENSLLIAQNTSGTTVAGPLGLPVEGSATVVRPGKNKDVEMIWTAPRGGLATLRADLWDMDPTMGDGTTYAIHVDRKVKGHFAYAKDFVGPRDESREKVSTTLASGLLENGTREDIFFGGKEILVQTGDKIRIILSGKGTLHNSELNAGDPTGIHVNIRVEDEPTRLQRTVNDRIESEAVIPKIELWGIGSQVKIRYDDVPDIGVDVRLGSSSMHLNKGSGTVTMQLSENFTGNAQSEGSLWIERSDTHAPITKVIPVDMGGGQGSALRALTLPNGPLELLPLAMSKVIITKATAIESAIRAELQSLLDQRPSIREKFTLSPAVTLSLSDRTSARAILNDLGGTSAITAWIGKANTASSVEASTASVWANMIFYSRAITANPAANLVQSTNLPNGLWMDAPSWPTHSRMITVPGAGSMTVTSDDGTVNTSTGITSYSHYMGVHNNVLAASEYGTTVNGFVNVSDFGKRWLRFSYPSPNSGYIRSISVAHLGGTHDGSIVLELADGTQRTIALDGSAEIPVNANIKKFTLVPGGRSTFGIAGISGPTSMPMDPITVPSKILKFSGAVATMDFSESQTMVSRVSGKLVSERPGDIFTVKAMKGMSIVESITIPSDSAFNMNNIEGITGILITHTQENAAFCVGDFMAEGERGSLPLPTDSMSPQTISALSTEVQPEFESGAQWPAGWMQQHNINTQVHPQVQGTATMNRWVMSDPTKYVLHTVMSSGGGSINKVFALTDQGKVELPVRLYNRVSGNSIITYPGAPQHLLFEISFSGMLDMAGVLRTGDDYETVCPPEGMALSANIINLSPQPVNVPGFGNPVFQINQPSYSQLTPGVSVGMLAQLTNTGLTGGLVTAKVYCGYYGDERDVLQGTFSSNFGPGEIRSLSCTVGAPGGVPSNSRPMITIICETPNGAVRTGWQAPVYRSSSEIRVVDPVTGQLKTIVLQPSAEDALAIARTQTRNMIAAQLRGNTSVSYQQAFTAAWNDYDAAVAREIAAMLASLEKPEVHAAAGQPLPSAEDIAKMGTNPLYGASAGRFLAYAGTSDSYASYLNASQREQLMRELPWDPVLYQEVTSWFTGRENVLGLGNLPVREETAQGRLFLAILQGTQNATSQSMADKLSLFSWCVRVGVTDMTTNGLDASVLSRALQGIDPNPSYGSPITETDFHKRRVLCLEKLFRIGQMGSIFSAPQTGPQAPISNVMTNKFVGGSPGAPHLDVYRPFTSSVQSQKDDYVIARFNAPHGEAEPYDYVRVSLADMNGNVIPSPGGQSLQVQSLGNLTFRIPLSQITALMGSDHIQDAGRDYHVDPVTGNMRNTFRLMLHAYPNANPGTTAFSLLPQHQFQVEVPSRLKFDAKEVLGNNSNGGSIFDGLTPAQQSLVTGALDFGELGGLGQNKILITWLVDHFLRSTSSEEHRMTFNSSNDDWEGKTYENGDDGECKYWLQNFVVNKANEVYLPRNVSNYSWEDSEEDSENVSQVLQATDTTLENFQEGILKIEGGLKAGDIIQMANTQMSNLHTMVVGSIEANGIWVFDSNYVSSHTPGYHKILFSTLNISSAYTIYRLT